MAFIDAVHCLSRFLSLVITSTETFFICLCTIINVTVRADRKMNIKLNNYFDRIAITPTYHKYEGWRCSGFEAMKGQSLRCHRYQNILSFKFLNTNVMKNIPTITLPIMIPGIIFIYKLERCPIWQTLDYHLSATINPAVAVAQRWSSSYFVDKWSVLFISVWRLGGSWPCTPISLFI